MSRVEIAPATLRDCSYIGANLRQADREEIFCQIPDDMSGSDAASMLFGGMLTDWTWIAYLADQPVCVFGVSPINVATWSGFAFGTKRTPRVVPAVTRHMLELEDRMRTTGIRRLEVRTLSTHDISHRWLRALGCWFEADLPHYGKNGETFELWAWHLGRLPSRYAKHRNRRYVHSQTKSPKTPSAPASGGAQER